MSARPQSGDGGMWRGGACGAMQGRQMHLHSICNHAPLTGPVMVSCCDIVELAAGELNLYVFVCK